MEIQLLATQQHWNLLYVHLKQVLANDTPTSALSIHKEQKIACFAVRGTATVQDVVTEVCSVPVPFSNPGLAAAWHRRPTTCTRKTSTCSCSSPRPGTE